LLVLLGRYNAATFNLSNLRIFFHYDAGTLIAFSERVLRHGTGIANGDRHYIAYYMRENVYKAVGVKPVDWMHYGTSKSQRCKDGKV
ncbi:hypothetical protein PAXRUDRAFT_170669, partial [Paxillus rubicundulus Ve08.2h10]